MTGAPNGNGGWVQMGGGYVPNPQGAPQPQQQQQGAPQQQFAPQAPQQVPMQWVPPGPQGSPMEGSAPIYPNVPQQYQPALPPMVRFGAQLPLPQAQIPQQQQFTPPAGADLNTRLTGPNIPQELQGRTLAEAMQIYNGMRNVVLETTTRPQQPAPASQQPAPVAGQPAGFDWRNPEASFKRVVEGVIDERMRPVLQSNQQQSIEQARRTASLEFGQAWTQLEPQIHARLAGASPEALANPAIWKTAAEAVLGADVLRFARQGGRQAPQTGQPMMQPQTMQQPAPNLSGFYTEQPNVGVSPGGGVQLTPTQAWAAQAMGMDQATYAAWAGNGPRR